MSRALGDGDAGVRRQAIVAAIRIGPKATPALRGLLEPGSEPDPANALVAIRTLAERRDYKAVAGMARILADAQRPLDVRLAALDALGQFNGPVPINARLMVLYHAASPPPLIARALPALGRAKLLPGNDVIGFLDHADPAVRAAALASFPVDKPPTAAVAESILIHTDDPAPEVRVALATAAGTHRIEAAIPKLIEWATLDGPIRAESIRALAAMPDRRALPAYVAALNDRDPDLRRVGLAALTTIRAAVLPELTSMAARGEFAGPGALLVERLLATFHPVEGWRVIGPFPRATGPIFADPRAIDFARPEPGVDGKPVAWQARHAHPKTGVVALDDLAPAAGGQDSDAAREPATAFAAAEIASDHARAALLIIHATGSVAIGLDDRPVANFAAGVAGETIRVDLKAGTNRLLLRTRQAVGPWTIRVEVSDAGAPGLAATRPPSAVREGLRAFALKHAGDAKNGAMIFAEARGAGCARCHGVGSTPAAVAGIGPDLTGLAAQYDKVEIIRSILDPSSRIAIGFGATTIAQADGTIVTGLIRAENAEAIELVLADGTTRKVAAREVTQRRTAEASTMPEGLVDGLQPVEFADLVAYLMSLKPPTRALGRAN